MVRRRPYPKPTGPMHQKIFAVCAEISTKRINTVRAERTGFES